MATDSVTTILDLETRRIAAMVRRDLATLDTLLADDLTYTHSAGHTDTKSSFMTLIKEQQKGHYVGVDYVKSEAIPSGNDTVIVRGKALMRLEDVTPYHILFVDVWSRRNGSWQMVVWHATRTSE